MNKPIKPVVPFVCLQYRTSLAVHKHGGTSRFHSFHIHPPLLSHRRSSDVRSPASFPKLNLLSTLHFISVRGPPRFSSAPWQPRCLCLYSWHAHRRNCHMPDLNAPWREERPQVSVRLFGVREWRPGWNVQQLCWMDWRRVFGAGGAEAGGGFPWRDRRWCNTRDGAVPSFAR